MALVTGPVAVLQLPFLQMCQGGPERVPGEGGAGGAQVLGGAVHRFDEESSRAIWTVFIAEHP
jgi:hypothetical protein